MHPAEALRGFLDALGVPPHRIPADLEARATLYRTHMAGRRMLVILDNARDPDQVRPLLPGTATSLVVVTSRNRLAGLVAAEGAHPLPLPPLTTDEARDLLTNRLGADRVAAEPGAVSRVITACAHLPLALTTVAANLADQPQLPLGTLTALLDSRHDRLDALTTARTPTSERRSRGPTTS